MFSLNELNRMMTRRQFFGRSARGLGAVALASLLNEKLFAEGAIGLHGTQGVMPQLHFAPKAKRVIYLFQSGAPSHLDLFDPKPNLKDLTGKELPKSVRGDQRITGMTSGQAQLLVAGSPFKFEAHGKCGMEISELLPHTARIVDEIALIRGMYTEPINHDPAVTFISTGNQQPGRPVMGAWMSYGLGSENHNLPAFVVLLSGGGGQPLQARYWGNGFLPSVHQGVQLRSAGDPVLYVSNPQGISAEVRRGQLDDLRELNKIELENVADPEIATRIEAYEMAYRMQTSVPELMDISKEPKEVLDLYGAKPGAPSFANNCLLARRLAERDVRFVQLVHRDWDHHGDLPNAIRGQCKQTDQASAALIMDLKQRGMLDDTLVIWGGEFGRTVYSQGAITANSFGRDHHPRCFSIWMAGGGIKGGMVMGKTDDYGYNLVADGLHVHDFHATVLHCLGINHEKLVYRTQGRDFRLTDVAGKVETRLLA
ncbi:MAG TPA: DUF1501 domain-containing protein [Tepidisphaeraceae bacterium]|jgi:hypothetical protein|nr:DUF1501 domain-containing protein [Tepidisphaeraceae bacterium]